MYKKIIFLFVASALLANCVHKQTHDRSSENQTKVKSLEDVGNTPQKLTVYLKGSCHDKNSESISLEDMKKIKKNHLNFSNSNEFPSVTIGNDHIFIGTRRKLFASQDRTTSFIDVSAYLQTEVGYEEYMDIELSFVKLNAQRYIYWKETYQNRPYNQGLLIYKNDEIYSYCKGRGGAGVIHF